MKKVCIAVFILLHLIITRFVIRIIDATVQIDKDYIPLILVVILLNVALYFLLRLIYKLLFTKKV